jgi:hypothetical protein
MIREFIKKKLCGSLKNYLMPINSVQDYYKELESLYEEEINPFVNLEVDTKMDIKNPVEKES